MRVFTKEYFAPAILVRDAFDNLATVREYQGPVLIIHGRADEVIPYSQAVALAQAARQSPLLLYNCSHECWEPSRLPFWRDMRVFLEEYGLAPPGSGFTN